MRRLSWTFCLAASAALAACPEPPPTADAGPTVVVEDQCDSTGAASSIPDCELKLGEEKTGYIAPVGDVDWYLLNIPDPLPARPILTLEAGYRAPSTPVVLRANILREDGLSSLGQAVDPRPRGAPGTAHIAVRMGGATTGAGRYFVMVNHDTSNGDDPAQDRKNPYYLLAKLTSDPDLNEPNDETPTPVTLPACGQAQISGALAVPGDVDKYTFTVTPCSGRTLLYLNIHTAANPRGDILVDYALDGPNGPVSTGHAATPFGEQTVATSRLAAAGTYTLTIRGYRASQTDPLPPGDPSFTYTADVRLLQDGDTNEGSTGNDTAATATPVPLSPGGQAKLFTGRFSYIGDYDYYAVQASGSRPSRLHYKVTWGSNSPRFEAVNPGQPHDLTVITTKGSANECRASCPDADNSPAADFCGASECLWSRRAEEMNIINFANFESIVQLPPGESGPFYVRVSYMGASGADDRDYVLSLELLPDEAPSSLSNPRSGNPAQGSIGYGYGYKGEGGLTNPPLERLPRSNFDYDLSDADYYAVTFAPQPPPPTPDGGTPLPAADMSMGLTWSVSGNNARPYDLGIRLYFCDDASCSNPHGTGGVLQYTDYGTEEWYTSVVPGWQLEYPITFDSSSGTFATAPIHCFCLDGKYAAAGKVLMSVVGLNRASYNDAQYTINTTLGSYPVTVTDSKGASFTCPTPCKFAENAIGY